MILSRALDLNLKKSAGFFKFPFNDPNESYSFFDQKLKILQGLSAESFDNKRKQNEN